MKVYSDILTYADFVAALPQGVRIHDVDSINNPRIRSRGWNIQLRDYSNNRHTNTGTHGAGEIGAASWDQWGEWMSELFERDPNARLGYDNSAADFHLRTHDKYRKVEA